MGFKIIDNKKVEMTEAEWTLYQKIVKSYPNGETLFSELFETNDDGIIIFLSPPSKKATSFEVYLFLMSLMQHQTLRLMYRELEDWKKKIELELKVNLSRKDS